MKDSRKLTLGNSRTWTRNSRVGGLIGVGTQSFARTSKLTETCFCSGGMGDEWLC